MLSEEKAIIEVRKLRDANKRNSLGKSIETILNLTTKLQKENEELKKYDYRNIKIDEKNEIKSPSFAKEQLDLMNLGIALYIGIPKLLKDEEETDI